MRCDDIYDRHDTSAIRCTCSEAKNNLRSHDLKNIGKEEQVYTRVKVISHK